VAGVLLEMLEIPSTAWRSVSRMLRPGCIAARAASRSISASMMINSRSSSLRDRKQ